jgi:hypothetical protein
MLTRIYLRHYAYLTRIDPNRPLTGIYHLATLGVGWLLSLVTFAGIALGLLVISIAIQQPILPWAAPKWVVVGVCAGIAFLPGWFVDRKMLHLRVVEKDLLDFYGSRSQRIRWWLGFLSILPLSGIVAASFMLLREGLIHLPF